MAPRETFASSFRAARTASGLSQEKLARDLNVSQTTVRNWETGRGLPGYDEFLRVCDYFGWPHAFAVAGRDKGRFPYPAKLTAVS